MSKLPDFETNPPDYEFDYPTKVTSPHVRHEGAREVSEYVCPKCGIDAKSPGGLGSHKKFAHSLDMNKVLDYDVIEAYAKLPLTRKNAIYNKELDMWFMNGGINVPDGYVIYSIALDSESIVDEKGRQNTVFKIRLIREEKVVK